MENSVLLNSIQMAEFAARGCLRFDGLIDESLNREFLDLFPVNIGSNDKIEMDELRGFAAKKIQMLALARGRLHLWQGTWEFL